MTEKLIRLLENLPPLVACVMWDVANRHITTKTIELANKATVTEWQQYDIVRCIAAANPDRPPTQEAQVWVDMMVEEFALEVA